MLYAKVGWFDEGDRTQTILEAGGAIGTELVRELSQAGKQVRLVGRNPKLVHGATETVSPDISDLDQEGFGEIVQSWEPY